MLTNIGIRNHKVEIMSQSFQSLYMNLKKILMEILKRLIYVKINLILRKRICLKDLSI